MKDLDFLEKEEESIREGWRLNEVHSHMVFNEGLCQCFNGDFACCVRLYLGTEQREEMALNEVASGNDTWKKMPKKKKGKMFECAEKRKGEWENNTAKKRGVIDIACFFY